MESPPALWDKFLPDQPHNNQYFSGTDYFHTLYDVISRSSDLKHPAETFKLTVSDKVSIEEMASNPIQLRFLDLIVRLTGAKQIFEIGSFIGLSAMTMARAMPAGGKITTIEKFDQFADICRKNFAANLLTDRIELLVGDAAEIVDKLPASAMYDIAFIDGNKERYAHYFEILEAHVRPGGLIIVDDVLFHGDAINMKPQTEKGAGVKAFLEVAAKRGNYLKLVLPICNGLMLMLKP